MAQNKLVSFPAVLLGTSVGNITSPPTLTGGVGIPTGTTSTYSIIRMLMIVNKTGAPVTFSCWKGASASGANGTEVFGGAQTVSANQTLYIPTQMRLDAGEYLTGLASVSNSLTVTPMGEMGVA